MKRPAVLVGIIRAVMVGAALILLAMVAADLRDFPRTEDAMIRANVAGVAAQVGGSISVIHVVDNQPVKKGRLLFEIDDRPYRAREAAARARLELIRMEVRALEDEIVAARAEVREWEARAAYAEAHYERLKPLIEGNFASADRVERARSEAASARAQLERSKAAVVQAISRLGEVDGKNTRIEEARAVLHDAELSVAFCKVYAPCDGTVTNLQITPGSYAAAGEQIFTIVNSTDWFALANFRETDLARIRPGQRATVYPMGRGPLTGRVEGIARAVATADGASLSAPGGEGVLSRVEPTFDLIQLARRFPVRIVFDEVPEDGDGLRMGGRAAVVIDTLTPPDPGFVRRNEQRAQPEFLEPGPNPDDGSSGE
ncbi:MAG: multidrug transporter subunit MdtN [Terrimicrobiaceae bacterium]